MTESKTKRRFLSVAGRRVHYRELGNGPPLVMLHGSPGGSEVLEHEMAVAAKHFRCIAFDNPGFGESVPLTIDVITVADLAAATLAAMQALGLPPCRVYGTHTGAAIAIELGVGWPDQVTGLVLEGLPIFTDAEIQTLFAGYFVPMVPDPLGGHLTSTWMRFRDQFTWFPWTARNVANLNPMDRPEPADIHHWVSMFYRSCKTYGPAYRAACYYGQAAYRAAEKLRVPTIYMASAEDMLYPHLERLPPLHAQQRIERLPYDAPAKYDAITRFVRSLPPLAETHTRSKVNREVSLVGHDPAVQFIDVPDGQIFVRCYGKVGSPTVVLLHNAASTGLALEAHARSLASHLYVIVPDLPGNGESEAPALDRQILDAAADGLRSIVEQLNIGKFAVAAFGGSRAVAARLSQQRDPRVEVFFVDSLCGPDENLGELIAPDLTLAADGSHWVRAWLMVRDGQIYDPWFDGRVAAQRDVQGNFDAAWLHDQTCALMKGRTSYQRFARAVFSFDTPSAFREGAAPVHVVEPRHLVEFITSTVLYPGGKSCQH